MKWIASVRGYLLKLACQSMPRSGRIWKYVIIKIFKKYFSKCSFPFHYLSFTLDQLWKSFTASSAWTLATNTHSHVKRWSHQGKWILFRTKAHTNHFQVVWINFLQEKASNVFEESGGRLETDLNAWKCWIWALLSLLNLKGDKQPLSQLLLSTERFFLS